MNQARDVPEMLDDVIQEQVCNPVFEWARIQHRLSEVRKDTLKTLGHTESSLRELEREAIVRLGEKDALNTDYGLVQLIPDKPVQWIPLREADPEKQKTRRLKLIKPKE